MTELNRKKFDETYHRVPVRLRGRTYPIHIGAGLLDNAGDYIGDLVKGRHVVIIVGRRAAHKHLPRLKDALKGYASRLDWIKVRSSESSKSFRTFRRVMEDILSLNVDREVMLIALGGGTIGDLVGFVAATLLRGVDYIQAPTTLLAQVDSAIGGKTGINVKAGKNLIGAFHQPRAVIADTKTLRTLPRREMRAGYAEVVKYGLLGDAAFFDWLDEKINPILSRDEMILAEVIAECCSAKAKIVAEDERESGRRALLNLGHTFAHAYEAEAGYDGSVPHGKAVAVGMTDAYRLGVMLGTSSPADLERVTSHLERAKLPTSRAMLLSDRVRKAKPETLIRHMRKDKKVADSNIVFIVPHGIGNAKVHREVDLNLVIKILEREDE